MTIQVKIVKENTKVYCEFKKAWRLTFGIHFSKCIPVSAAFSQNLNFLLSVSFILKKWFLKNPWPVNNMMIRICLLLNRNNILVLYALGSLIIFLDCLSFGTDTQCSWNFCFNHFFLPYFTIPKEIPVYGSGPISRFSAPFFANMSAFSYHQYPHVLVPK